MTVDQRIESKALVKRIDNILLNVEKNFKDGLYRDCPYKELESLVNSLYKARMAASNILVRYGDHSMMDTMPKVKIE